MARNRNVIVFSCCMVVSTLIPGAQPTTHAQQTRGAYSDVRKLPEGAIGKRITELIDIINSNDPAKVRTLVEQGFAGAFCDAVPIEEHLSVFAQVYDQSRGLEFYAVRKYQGETTPNEYVVIVRNKLTQGWQGLVMQIDPQPPHQIIGLMFAPARPPSDLPAPKKLSEQDIAKDLDVFVRKLANAEVFSGAVLLAKDGRVLFKGAYGPACRQFNVPNKVDTKFNLGSMNKMFTAVAIAQLVQQGKLSFDDPLSKFVSTEWLPAEITEKITIKHLLTHTSGLGSYFNEKFMQSSRDLYRELDDYKPLVAGETPAFEPGTDWSYSNTGFLLLGVVIEKVTGQSYFDYVRENVYKPAGMTNTDCYEMDKPVPNLAIGYSKEPSKRGPEWTNNLFKHVIKGGPAGGGFSTVEDLLKFDMALRSHRLLNRELTELLWTPKPEVSSPEYGFGFGVYGSAGNRMIGHGGGFPGISSNLDMFLDSGYTAVVLSNYDNGSQPVTEKIRELLGARD